MKNKITKAVKILIFGIIIYGGIKVTTSYSRIPSDNKFTAPISIPQYILDEQRDIIAIWVSEEDNNSRMEFTSGGTCYSYYGLDLTETYNYSISNTTPQCGTDVLIDDTQETSYLQLIDEIDGSVICFEINGINELLSLTKVDSGKLLIFNKQ